MDERIFRLLNESLSGPLLDRLMATLSDFRSSRPFVISLVLAAALFGGRKARLIVMGSLILAGTTDLVSSQIMKEVVGRARPCAVLEGVKLPEGYCPVSGSFPSSHAASSFAVATYASIVAPPLAVILFPLATGIALSRVYLGVHYPTDVVGGALIGSLLALLLARPIDRASRRLFPPCPTRPSLAVPPPTLAEKADDFLARGGRLDYRRAFLLLVVLSTVANLVVIASGKLGLGPDEARAWLCSRGTGTVCATASPLIEWTIAAATRLAGDSTLAIRLPAALLSAVSLIAVFHLSRILLASEAQAFLVALLLRACPFFSATGVFLREESFVLPLWSLALLLFWIATRERNGPLAWIALGGAIGLGSLAHWTMFLFAPLMLACLALSPDLRPWLSRKEPYLSVILGALAFASALAPSVRGERPLLGFLGAIATPVAEGNGPQVKLLGDFILRQIGIVSPLLAAAIAWALARTTVRALRSTEATGTFLAATSLPILALFLALSPWSSWPAAWSGPAYVAGSIAAVRETSRLYASLSTGRKRKLLAWAQGSLALGFVFTALGGSQSLVNLLAPTFPLSLHPMTPVQRWGHLAREVSRVQDEMGGPREAILMSDSLDIAAELSFHLPGHPSCFWVKPDGDEARGHFLTPLREAAGKDAVYVTEGAEGTRGRLPQDAFESCQSDSSVRIVRRKHTLRTFSLFRCRGYHGLPQALASRPLQPNDGP